MAFRVKSVIDGNSFTVSPNWKWRDLKGNIVKINGYEAPIQGQPGYQISKSKLTGLILGKEVVLKKPSKSMFGRIHCDVLVEGNNLTSYFSEYKV